MRFATRPPKRRCENCRYWSEYEDDMPGREGDCVRFPPSHIPMEGDPLFFGNPMTGVNCTCGEWRADDGKHRWRPPKGVDE